MTPEPSADLAEASIAPGGASRARLVLLLLCLVAWLLPWAEAFPRDGAPVARPQTGAERTGALAAIALVAALGLAATSALARTRRGLALGEAATSLAVAAVATALLAARHPWIPGGERRGSWIPIFLPLALLAGLDLLVRLSHGPVGREITAIRAASAILAGAALAVALQAIPAAVALLLGLLPASSLAASSARAARRAVEALSLALAVLLAFATEMQAAIDPPPAPIRGFPLPDVGFRACALGLALVALLSLRATGRDADTSTPS